MKITTLGTGHGDPTPTRFNTSTLLETGGRYYLLDAGAPVTALLIRKQIDLNHLRAVFITHMHEDHYAGLSGVIKHQAKKAAGDAHTAIYLPEAGARFAIHNFAAAAHRPIPESKISYHTICRGAFYEDEIVRLTAIPTRHFSNENLDYPSYALVIEAENKKVLYTGDLRFDFADFPVAACVQGMTCFCELTHYDLASALPILRRLPLDKLIFTHIGDAWHGAAAEQRFTDIVSALPYPAVIAQDGDEFELSTP